MTSARDNIPFIYTTEDTTSNKTGTWRYLRPVFELKNSPCAAACPAGNPIVEFMSLVNEGRLEDALRAIKKENPLPGVCGRVCPHPCTAACNRGGFDSPVAVNIVERLLGDAEEKFGLCIPKPADRTGKSVAVIGAGPAGLSCAYHSALSGHGVTVFDAGKQPGGLLRLGIPPYRLPRNVLDRELEFLKELNINVEAGSRVWPENIKEISEKFDAVCVAVGAHGSPGMGIEGESLDRVFPGLRFLEQVNAGNLLAVGRHVLVAGGGNTAIDAARAAIRCGASDVVILYRRGREDMPALADEIAEAEEEGISFLFYATPIKLLGQDDRFMSAVIMSMRPGEPDSSGRPRPVPIKGSEYKIHADSIIEAIGGQVEYPFAPETGVEVDGWGVTNIEKIFVCGDAAPGDRTVAHAIGSGKRAAIAIDARLRGRDIETVKKRVTIGQQGTVSAGLYRSDGAAPASDAGPQNVNFAYYTKSPAEQTTRLEADQRIKNFDEINVITGGEAARREAARCFNCGHCNDCGNCLLFCPDMSIIEKPASDPGTPGFDSDYCKGCGICARECPCGIITMLEEDK